MHFLNRGVALLCAALTLTLASANQQDDKDDIIDLRPYTVSGTVDSRRIENSLIAISELNRNDLNRSNAISLGESLQYTTGVHSTSFGAGASRPIIRGFEGSRIAVLEDGKEIFDVSDGSPDHAVTVLPDFAEYIDIIRGPATLLYGNSAIGGVVNVVGNRIPIRRGNTAVEWKTKSIYESVSNGWNLLGMGTVNLEDGAVRVNVSSIHHGDYAIPSSSDSMRALEAFHEDEVEAHHEDDESHEEKGRLSNSFVDHQTVSIGSSWFIGEKSRVSASYYNQQSEYGVPGHSHFGEHDEHDEHDEHEENSHEDGVYIDLNQSKMNLEGSIALDNDIWKQLDVSFLFADYQHQEIEGDEVGTEYKRRGWESRVSMKHEWNEDVVGVWGMQFSSSESESIGEEALVPYFENKEIALFALEEFDFERLDVNVGARMEWMDLDVFEQQSVEEFSSSISGGTKIEIHDQLFVSALLSRTERSPNATELFANGAHIATRQYEVGNVALSKETVWSGDFGIQWESDRIVSRVNVFVYDFSDYIYSAPQNEFKEGVQVFAYESADVIFHGVEWETDFIVWNHSDSQFHLRLMMDRIDSDISNSSESLPRTPPARVGAAFEYIHHGGWTLWGRAQYGFKQDDVAEYELPMDGYHQVDIGVEYQFRISRGEAMVFLKGTNLLDEEIRKHTSFLKDVAPLPGRSLEVGIILEF